MQFEPVIDIAPTHADIPYMATRHVLLSDQVRQAIHDAGCSRYAISKATGIDQSVLSKFVSGERGISMESLDRLAEFLRLEIVVRKDPSSKGR